MDNRLGKDKAVIIWLLAVCMTIFAMVVVGGITRLTDSGLSMVDWQPILGTIPPVNHNEWQAKFEMYQQFPEYQKVNRGMSLGEFKAIFYWEYGHRVLGRLIGLMFFFPFLIFYFQGRFDGAMKVKMTLAFIVGGLQGLMGWYMVKSGLVDMPRVSHFRLAAHLGLALLLLGYLFWVVLELYNRHGLLPRQPVASTLLRRLVRGLFALLLLQILYGAFTAGLRAGYGYNTFPLMNDEWIAAAVGIMDPWWVNLFESNATVQFLHRWLGILVLLQALVVWFIARRQDLRTSQSLGLNALAVVTLIQFVLGVATLLYVVPVGLASLHQAGACLLLLVCIYALFTLGSSDKNPSLA
jgi:cytochrome c oxidase assembly protein subunit 15